MRTFLCIIVLLFCVYIPDSNATFYELKKSQTGFGIGFSQASVETRYLGLGKVLGIGTLTSRTVTKRNLGVHFDYGYGTDNRTYFRPGISFTETGASAIPPAPTAEVGILFIKSVSSTSVVSYYLGSSFGVEYQQNRDAHALGFSLFGYSGLLARLQTESNLTFIPYFGVAFGQQYLRYSAFSEIVLDGIKDNVRAGIGEEYNFAFNGNAGMEMEISPSLSVLVSWSFSFEVPDSTFMLQVNFH